ncbi:olfactory receptor 1019-like [Terrapene carolina triunguis]|uniref:olfactory receptor 1019-like n=1 Tax=Terrapene triunguis TaxID=2587831 RepID=UPI000E77BA0F|nr:olfactory receptor 1019-like [Terrapene carolina triunguis]
MKGENSTSVTKFILLDLSSNLQEQLTLFGVFTAIYLVALMGNMLILPLISLDSRLHTLMYFLLGNFSVVDIGSTSSTMPKMLANYLSQDKSISWAFCLCQMFFFISFRGIECLLLGVMAYDRYVAICHHLHYGTFMSRRACTLLAAAAWVMGLTNSTVHSSLISILSFCWGNVLRHFFCDILPLFQLSCSNTWANQAITFALSGAVILDSLLGTLVSYVYIVLAVLRIRTSEGHLKAFSTCTSHLVMVSLYFGIVIFTYIHLNSTYPQHQDRAQPMLYGIVTPMLNPIIYTEEEGGERGTPKSPG